jgi:uncharacterized protein (TIGR02453 family)
MISKDIFEFLIELKKNNNREWLYDHKAEYEKVKQSLIDFISYLIQEIKKFDFEIAVTEPKDCLFRINRDVRFSKDKNPYKTNFGIFIAKGGKNGGNAGYYLHIEDNNSFIGGGIYLPSPEKLKLIRKEIFYNTIEFKNIIKNPVFTYTFKEIWDDNPLKKAPKEFPADFEDIDLLKFRNYTVIKNLSNSVILSEIFGSSVINIFKVLYPFNRFINRAFD